MKQIGRSRRHKRIAKKAKGTEQRPRLVVFRSKKHIYVQIINDTERKVVIGCSTLSKDFKGFSIKGGNKAAAEKIGELIAKKAEALGIKKVCFDRGGYKYHGRVKSLAQAARKGGLEF